MMVVNFWQNGHRGTRLAITTPDSIFIVAIEVGLCRSVRIGGATGSLTSGYAKERESRFATIWAGGKKSTLRDQKGVGGNTHRRVMMKAAPSSDFVTSQSQVFEFFVIALNRPTPFGGINKPLQRSSSGQRQKPVFGRIALIHGPLHQQPLFRTRSLSPVITISRAHPRGAELRAHLAARSFTPSYRAKRVATKLVGQLSNCQRLMLRISSQKLRWLAPASCAAHWRRERPFSRRPDHRRFPNTDRITQPASGQGISKDAIVAKAGVSIDQCTRQISFQCGIDLCQCDVVLGAKPDLARHARLFPSRPIVSPVLRQVEFERDRQTSQLMRERQRDGHLTVVYFPQLAAVLPRNSYRVLTAFGETSIVKKPAFNLSQVKQGRQRILTNSPQERTITPGSSRNEMMQRLMLGTHPSGINLCRQRLDAFTFARQEQAGKIFSEWLDAVKVIKLFAQQREVMFKTLFTGFKRCGVSFHHPMPSNFRGN